MRLIRALLPIFFCWAFVYSMEQGSPATETGKSNGWLDEINVSLRQRLAHLQDGIDGTFFIQSFFKDFVRKNPSAESTFNPVAAIAVETHEKIGQEKLRIERLLAFTTDSKMLPEVRNNLESLIDYCFRKAEEKYKKED